MGTPPVPDPRLEDVRNDTPFELFQCDKMGVGRRFFDTVVVKGTFALTPQRVGIAREQLPIVLGDELWDRANAERSSLKHAGEVLLTKPSTRAPQWQHRDHPASLHWLRDQVGSSREGQGAGDHGQNPVDFVVDP